VKLSFKRMCALLAAKRCYEAGQSVRQIAKSAGKSPSTIRRWLKTVGVDLLLDNQAAKRVPCDKCAAGLVGDEDCRHCDGRGWV